MTGFRRLTLVAGLALTTGVASAQTSDPPRPPDQRQLPAEHPAEAPAPPVSLSAVVNEMIARFPRVEGDVVEVDGARITLSVGRRDGVREGLALAVVREGREIRHPRTDELLGRTEEAVGRATVVQVSEAFSVATLEGATAQVNDRARSGAGKMKVTLVPLRAGVKENLVEAVMHELYDGLLGTGRFEVVLGDQIAVWVGQQGIKTEEFLEGRGVAEAGRRFKTEQMLAVAFSTVERRPFMDVRLFSPPRPEPVLASAFFVPSSIKPRVAGQFSASDRTRVTRERKPRSLLDRLLRGDVDPGAYSSGEASIPLREVARFAFPVVALDMAVPADRVPRVAVSDGSRVFVYKVVDRSLEAEWSYTARNIGQVVSVYLVDIDGDGAPEVAVNRYDVTLGVNSMILGAREGRLRVLADNIRSFLVGIDETGSGLKQALWIQEMSPITLFAPGRVERAALKDGKLQRLEKVRVPESFRATGVTTSNVLGRDGRALVYVDEYNRLRITFGNEDIYRSSAPVGGGGYVKLELPHRGADAGVSKFFEMQPTPLAVDLDGDGVEEIVVPQNQLPGMLAVLFKGPTGVRFQQVPTGFEGVITGLGAVRGDDREPPTLFASVVRFSGILNVKTASETQIVMTVEE